MKSKLENWKELSREISFLKYGRGIERRSFLLSNGNETDFCLYFGHDSVACLALTKENQVILARQFRPGPLEVLNEMPGGGMKENETEKEAIERELFEETGYRGKVEYVGFVFPNAYATYKKHVFCITDCEKVSDPIPEENGEMTEVVLLSIDEFRELIRSGQMTDVELGYRGLDFLHFL